MLKTKQLSVMLPNKRGQLAALSRCLADARANILALSVLESTELGTVRLVVNKPKEAAKALKKAGMAFTQTNVLVAQMPNKVGVLADVCGKLADRGVSINFMYGSTGRGRGPTHVVIGCNKMPTAEKALRGY